MGAPHLIYFSIFPIKFLLGFPSLTVKYLFPTAYAWGSGGVGRLPSALLSFSSTITLVVLMRIAMSVVACFYVTATFLLISLYLMPYNMYHSQRCILHLSYIFRTRKLWKATVGMARLSGLRILWRQENTKITKQVNPFTAMIILQ